MFPKVIVCQYNLYHTYRAAEYWSVQITYARTIDLPAQPRAKGDARVSVRLRDGKSVIRGLRQSGASKLLFPKTASNDLTAVILNCAGGVTGGDQFSTQARVGRNAGLVMTTQAAERAYRAQPKEIGTIDTRLTVAPNARLAWLPQETLIYDGASIKRRLRIRLARSAQVLACEMLVMGRTAQAEHLTQLQLADDIDIIRDGRLIFADRLRLSNDAERTLQGPAVLAGARSLATVILAAPGVGTLVDALRPTLPEKCGIAAPDPDLLVARLTADDSFLLRQTIVPLLARLGVDPLPRTWML
ncbi:MAG: urease accessory protein UreD [Pseudoprimorskyibacter sp.]|nr:urease accessory protein UreD [Pseudoprimorskyibacter sp.]